MKLYNQPPPPEFVWPVPAVEHSRESKLGFCMTLMYRAVFHNRKLLIMATDSLGQLLKDNKPECKLLATVYDLCEIQEAEIAAAPQDENTFRYPEFLNGVRVAPAIPDSPEIETAMRALDEAVARLLRPVSAVAYQTERGSNFRELRG